MCTVPTTHSGFRVCGREAACPECAPLAAFRMDRRRLPCILIGAERSKGAAGSRCRYLDGRAAILPVVARPGGCRLAARVRGSSSRWSFIPLGQIPPAKRRRTAATMSGHGRPLSRPEHLSAILSATRLLASSLELAIVAQAFRPARPAYGSPEGLRYVGGP
jgi:hypothetical protein